MNMPGFTAVVSLYKANDHFRSITSSTTKNDTLFPMLRSNSPLSLGEIDHIPAPGGEGGGPGASDECQAEYGTHSGAREATLAMINLLRGSGRINSKDQCFGFAKTVGGAGAGIGAALVPFPFNLLAALGGWNMTKLTECVCNELDW